MRSSIQRVLPIAAGVLAGVLLLGSAQAVTSGTFTYSNKRVGYLAVSPADLEVGSSALTFSVSEASMSGAGCHFGGLHLPQGAQLVSVKFFETEGISAPLQLDVYRVNLATGTEQFKVLTPTTDGTRQTFTITVPGSWGSVDNGKYTYTLGVCHDPSGEFHGAQVRYTYTSAGD